MSSLDPTSHSTVSDAHRTMLPLIEAFNAARGYQALVDAIVRLLPNVSGAVLWAFEGFDDSHAAYIEPLACGGTMPEITRHIPKPHFSDAVRQQKWWLADSPSDAVNPERDEGAAAHVLLSAGERLWGVLALFHDEPQQMRDTDGRFLLTLGTLISGVMERIRAQKDTDQAHGSLQFLYELAADVNAATTPEEVLQAALALAPDCNGLYLTLFENLDYEKAAYAEITTGVNITATSWFSVGMRQPLEMLPLLGQLRHQSIWSSEDVLKDVRIDPISAALCAEAGTRAMAAIRLLNGEHFAGVIFFNFSKPRKFSVQGSRIAQGVGSLVMSALERLRFEAEIHSANEESAFLYRLAESVNAVTTYQDLIDAVGRLQPDCQGVYLNLWEDSRFEGATYYEVVAAANAPPQMQHVVGQRFPKDSFPMMAHLYEQRMIVVEDTTTIDPRFEPLMAGFWITDQAYALVALPLIKGGRYLGALFFYYAQPRRFSLRERQIKIGMSELILAAVERIESQQETSAANEESAFMYWLAESINAATTYQAVCEAVAHLTPDCDGIYLDFWEHFDYEQAGYLEIMASANVADYVRPGVGDKLFKEDYPILQHIHNERIAVIEDIYNDLRVDPLTRNSWSTLGTQAIVCLFLYKDSRNTGGLFFNYTKPRKWSSRERRIALGIGELVMAATERIRLQAITQIAHERTEVVASINAALLRANDEASILAALERYVEAQGATEMILTYAKIGEQVNNTDFQPVARWLFRDPVPYQTTMPDGFHDVIMVIRDLAIQEPDKIFYVEDVASDERLLPEMRADFVTKFPMRAEAVVGLSSGGRWQGSLVIIWHQPHEFSEQEKQVYSRLLQNLPSVVASRRAYLAEQASRSENELLYTISKAINQATTVDDVMNAVKQCFPDSLDIALIMWENYDFSTANYAQVAVSTDAQIPVGIRWEQKAWSESATVDEAASYVIHSAYRPNDSQNIEPRVKRSIAFSNLCQDKRSLGILSLASRAQHEFTEGERRLISAMTDLTAAALERFRLQQKTESARHQAETLAQISAALSQVSDERSILSALGDLMKRYDVNHGALSYSVYDDHQQFQGFRAGSLWTLENGIARDEDVFSERLYVPDKLSLLQIVLSNPETALYVEDVFSDPRPEVQATIPLHRKSGRNAHIIIPLYNIGLLRGIVSFIWYEAQTFTPELWILVPELQRLLSAVVSTRLAYLAMDQARKETEQRVLELETFAEVSAAAAAIREEQQLLRTFVRLMQTNFTPNRIQVYLLADDNDSLLPWSPPDEQKPGPLRLSLHEHLSIARAVKQRRVVLGAERENVQPSTPSALPTSVQYSAMDVPMIVNQRVVGVLSFRSPNGQRTFSDGDTRVISTMADLIAVAIQNARFFQQAQELAALEERTRLARELHDSVSQALYGIGLGAQTARRALDSDPQLVRESVEYVLSLAEAGLAEMRALIFELRPESLESEGLVVALAKQGASLQARHGIDVIFELCDEPSLTLSTKESLYRVAREALHNVIKHAAASRIVLKMVCADQELQLEVVDDGVGFAMDQEFPGHLGLHSMRERVRQLNGTIDILSAPGQGTCLTVRLPLQP